MSKHQEQKTVLENYLYSAIPCDIRVKFLLFKKGTKLRTIIESATRWFNLLCNIPRENLPQEAIQELEKIYSLFGVKEEPEYMGTKVHVAQGKYTVVLSDEKPMYFLRYGELWSDKGETIRYGNMIASMAWELYDLREEVKKLKAL